MPDGRGGYQKPNNPAPVSLPQSGRRTDGGAGDGQKIRTPTGGSYGSAKALTDQQQGAPMASGGPATAAGGPGGTSTPPPSADAGAFGPTQRPNEPNTAGASASSDVLARNPQAALRVLYSKFPHPSIARLIDWSSSGGLESGASNQSGGQPQERAEGAPQKPVGPQEPAGPSPQGMPQ